jgi:hypothetical protein
MQSKLPLFLRSIQKTDTDRENERKLVERKFALEELKEQN